MSESVGVTHSGRVAVVELRRPPNNIVDEALLRDLADAIHALNERDTGAVVLRSTGKHFCTGADLRDVTPAMIRRIYAQAFRLFTGRLPIVAAVNGAAIGAGLGLALAADFRVAAAVARMSANFAVLGFHHGFGLTATLPAVVGMQRTLDILYTGRMVTGTEALEIGLVDEVVEGDPSEAAFALAERIAASAPLSIPAIRSTMRRGLVSQVVAAMDVEAAAQVPLLDTHDFSEGVAAVRERRPPQFTAS